MSQGNDLSNYSAASASGSTGSEEVWFVAVASDDIKQMTVDQLDEAFRLGIITAETAVWTEGMDAWAPLGQVADLDADSEADGSQYGDSQYRDSQYRDSQYGASGPAAHLAAPEWQAFGREEREVSGTSPAMSSEAMSSGAMSSGAMSSPSMSPPAGGAPSASALQHASLSTAALQGEQHGFSQGPNSISPVTSSYAPGASLGSSGPVALNVDEDMPALRRGRRFRPERWALGAAVLVAAGIVGYNNMFSPSVTSASTQATAAAAVPTVSRAYDVGDDRPEKLNTQAAVAEEAPAGKPSAGSAAALADSSATKAADEADEADGDESPASTKGKRAEKDELRGKFSKAFGKKSASARSSKARARKAARRATKARATKARASKATRARKKRSTAKAQSAFDPLNDSLP